MQPHERIRHVFFNLIRKIFIFVGHDFFAQEHFKPYFLTYVMYGCEALMYIGTVKTICFYDIAQKLNVIAFVGIAFQVKHVIYLKILKN